MIDFEYSLDEIVQMEGKGAVSLRTALIHLPDRIGPQGILHREVGKIPAFFNVAEVQALIHQHKKELEIGNPIGRREADEDDFYPKRARKLPFGTGTVI